jgi:dTDP-glucose 4,6-dehydratase
VVHLAAETHVARSIFDNTKFFQTDVIGTQTLVNALLNNASVERFIHISTSEVYGSSVREIMDEDHPLNPMSPYAGAKAGADRLVHSYWSYSDLPIVILRPFNNYGPGQHMEKMIPRFVTSAIKNEPLTVHGRGTAARDWLFVEDHCEAIDRVLHADDFSRIKNQVINIGTGRATSVLDVAKMVLRLLGRPDDLIGFIGDRPGQVQRHCSSTEKARAMLGWESKTALEEGLARTIEWYRTHEPWWREQEWMKCVPIRTAKGSIEMH